MKDATVNSMCGRCSSRYNCSEHSHSQCRQRWSPRLVRAIRCVRMLDDSPLSAVV